MSGGSFVGRAVRARPDRAARSRRSDATRDGRLRWSHAHHAILSMSSTLSRQSQRASRCLAATASCGACRDAPIGSATHPHGLSAGAVRLSLAMAVGVGRQDARGERHISTRREQHRLAPRPGDRRRRRRARRAARSRHRAVPADARREPAWASRRPTPACVLHIVVTLFGASERTTRSIGPSADDCARGRQRGGVARRGVADVLRVASARTRSHVPSAHRERRRHDVLGQQSGRSARAIAHAGLFTDLRWTVVHLWAHAERRRMVLGRQRRGGTRRQSCRRRARRRRSSNRPSCSRNSRRELTSPAGLSTTGAAYCWGENAWATLGDGTKSRHARPAPVKGGLTFQTLTTGGHFACGLTDGPVYCWGAIGLTIPSDAQAALGPVTLGGNGVGRRSRRSRRASRTRAV